MSESDGKTKKQDRISIDDRLLEFRLDAIRDSQKMSRLAFLVLTIVSVAVIITTWNAYFSWYVGFPLQEDFPGSEVTETVQKEIIEQWVESSMISVPLLGIKIGASDASVFGSIAILIISIWFSLSVRRQNHAIGFLLFDTKDDRKETRRAIFHGIAAYMLFTNITRRADPIKNLQAESIKHQPDSLMRWAFKILIFLPSFAIFALILSDIATVYFVKAPYRFPHLPLIVHLDFNSIIKLIAMESLASVLLIIITIISFRVLSYVECTAKILRDYSRDFILK